MLFPRKYRQTLARPADLSRCNKPSSPWFRDQEGRFFSAYEIEAVLEGVNGVSEAAVVRRHGAVRAYYTTVSGKPWPGIKERLRAAVRAELEGREHMWPASYVKLTQMPYLPGTKKIRRAKLAAGTWRSRRSKAVEVPAVREPVSQWQFEGIIEAIPSRATIIVAHRLGPRSAPVRLTISRENLSLRHQLNAGRWGIFEGYFKGEGAMMLTKFKLMPAPVKQIPLGKVDAVFEAL